MDLPDALLQLLDDLDDWAQARAARARKAEAVPASPRADPPATAAPVSPRLGAAMSLPPQLVELQSRVQGSFLINED